MTIHLHFFSRYFTASVLNNQLVLVSALLALFIFIPNALKSSDALRHSITAASLANNKVQIAAWCMITAAGSPTIDITVELIKKLFIKREYVIHDALERIIIIPGILMSSLVVVCESYITNPVDLFQCV
jgi:hypothetical protein